MATGKLKKKQAIRNNEYYDTQAVFDDLYAKAKQNHNFTNLLDTITSEQNILLAYRNIKKNKGSKTSGTNKSNIIDIGEKEPWRLVTYVRARLDSFAPHSVRRVEIEKYNGTLRPLGIPTIEDRLIQQCIKQVLEPICEAQFYKHSYGFRPNRSTHHAIARTMFLTNRHNFQYVIDIDIKGFFDNVNHAKLLKQMWAMGIRDKNLLCILSKMLKAEIKGIGIPTKGVPQGGILSPLLSNIVLNELDWWIANQWDNKKTVKDYAYQSNKLKALKRSKLKEVYIVRYADDFKLFCKSRDAANKLFIATKQWLSERLGLEISPEKSKIVNLKRHYSEFLGIRLKLWKRGNQDAVKSYMTEKSVKKCKENLKGKVKSMQKETTIASVMNFNAAVLGVHNYYSVATNVNLDFCKIAYSVNKSLKCRTKRISSKKGKKSKTYQKYYGDYDKPPTFVHEIALFPIVHISNRKAMGMNQDICNYTQTGRKLIHDNLSNINSEIVYYLMRNPVFGESVEFNDNRISLYVAQNGKCFITGEALEISNMEVHHKTPQQHKGKDNYKNLVFVSGYAHKLIHATEQATIEKYIQILTRQAIDFKRLNQLRVSVGNLEI